MKQNPWTGHFVDEEGNTWFADEDLKVAGVNNWAQAPNKGVMPLKDWRQDPNGGNWVDQEGKHWSGDEPDFQGYTAGNVHKYAQTPPTTKVEQWKQDPNGGNFVDNEGKHWSGYEPTFPGNTWAHASAQMQTPPLKDWK